jgi:integrase/recombinase XerD
MQRSKEEVDLSQIDFNNDPNFDRKLDLITAGASRYLKQHLLTKISRENCSVIINYILAMQTETNTSQHYRVGTISTLKQLAEFHNNKAFKDMTTRQDILAFLDRLRKPESVDPTHKWIGTYELTRIVLLRFFKWLHAGPNRNDIPAKQRPTPDVMLNIPRIKRRQNEQYSKYKPTDLWTEEDDSIFYKYCPSLRDKCYHAIARDTGCRVSEMLKIKIKDIVFQQTEEGYQIARLTVNGKTGVQNKRLYNSLPRLKDWLTNGHPYPANPNSPLFCGFGRKNTGRVLVRHRIHSIYQHYKEVHFPQILKDPLVPEEDKLKIRDLLQKPWNPHALRHTAATEVFKALKDPKLMNQYFGWSENSNMWKRYSHYFNDDSFDAILTVMDGLKPPSNVTNSAGKKKGLLKPRVCPNCSEMNKPENRFCSKCKFVLSFDAYNEKLDESENLKKELAELKAQQQSQREELEETIDERMQANFEKIYAKMMRTFGPKLNEIKDEKKRNAEETKLLWDASTTAEVELEEALDEQAAQERLAAYEEEKVRELRNKELVS